MNGTGVRWDEVLRGLFKIGLVEVLVIGLLLRAWQWGRSWKKVTREVGICREVGNDGIPHVVLMGRPGIAAHRCTRLAAGMQVVCHRRG